MTLIAGGVKMPIDPTILLKYKPFEMETPLESQNKVLDNRIKQGQLAAQGDQSKFAELKMLKEKNDYALQLLSTATDQSSYDANKARAQAAGLDVSNFPPQFDPQVIRQAAMSSLSLRDQIDLAFKREELDIKRGESQIQPMPGYGNPSLKDVGLPDQAPMQPPMPPAVNAPTSADYGNVDLPEKLALPPELNLGSSLPIDGAQPAVPIVEPQPNKAQVQSEFTPLMKGNKPFTEGLPTGYVWAEDSQGQRMAMRIPGTEKNLEKKPLSVQAIKLQNEATDAIKTSKSINADLSAVILSIDQGKIKFGPVTNLKNMGKNALGMSDEQSRNFASFKSTLEKLRNDSLRLNKGVQTDGDAQRAWNEILTNINDTALVKQRLQEVQRLNERAVELRKLDVDMIRENFNQEPLDYSTYDVAPAIMQPNKDFTTLSDDELLGMLK